MKHIIYNSHLPFGRYMAMTFCEWIIARREYAPLNKRVINHEHIHIAQCREMLYIGFYLWYGIEYLVRLIQKRNSHAAYHAISFEREAYENEHNPDYLKVRPFYNWLRLYF